MLWALAMGLQKRKSVAAPPARTRPTSRSSSGTTSTACCASARNPSNHDSPIVGGLIELAWAWEQSTRVDKMTRASNSGTRAYEGRGAVLNQIDINVGMSHRKGHAGGESTAEGLWDN